jgi:hypothetical protein
MSGSTGWTRTALRTMAGSMSGAAEYGGRSGMVSWVYECTYAQNNKIENN